MASLLHRAAIIMTIQAYNVGTYDAAYTFTGLLFSPSIWPCMSVEIL